MHPGAGRASPDPAAENGCVQLLHFLMENQPSALQKASLGGQERVFSLCGTQELCPVHAGW